MLTLRSLWEGSITSGDGTDRPRAAQWATPPAGSRFCAICGDRGVKFVTGMDAGMTNANFDDFAYIPQVMVEEMRITPMEAIVCSTKTSAECLGLEDEIGTLEVGKSADVLIINGNPSEDITALHDVNTIVSQGKVVKRENELLI